jgi:hypothetical protein
VNLATLPENYSAQFYVQHLASWPALALVAEYQDAVDPNPAAPPPNPPAVVRAGDWDGARQWLICVVPFRKKCVFIPRVRTL